MATVGVPFSWGYLNTQCLSYPELQSITHLLTGGFFFETSAIILLAGGSLFQPEKSRETKDLQQHLKLKSSPPSHAPSPFIKGICVCWLQQHALSSRDMGMQLEGSCYVATNVHGHHRHCSRSCNTP